MTSDQPNTVAQQLTEAISKTIETAEEMTLKPIARGLYDQADIITARLVPALIQARSYTELGMTSQPEVTAYIAQALDAASTLLDGDNSYSRLHSALQRLREDAYRARRPA